jgi:hypothetical protein
MQKGIKVMPDDLTKLSIDWDSTNLKWRFQATREGTAWAWMVTPEDFKHMIETMSDMDDELNQRLGERLRSKVNKKDNK